MRWPKKHILSLQKNATTASRSSNDERWHRDVKSAHVILDFLAKGHPAIESISFDHLKEYTTVYLSKLDTNILPPSSERDKIVEGLIDEHAINDPLTTDVAILACTDVLTHPVAIRRLSSLMGLDIERYLRCIIAANKINLYVVSNEELRCAQCLLRILSLQVNDFHELQQLVELIRSAASATLTPIDIVKSALSRSGIRISLQRQLAVLLDQRRFMTLFNLVSWLHQIPRIQDSNDILAVLDYLPSWSWLLAWKPNLRRIDRWERGRFSEAQRQKLLHLFDLDGPDTVTQRMQSLKLAEPQCYAHIHPDQRSAQALEELLELLYKAQCVGPNAMKLFLELCIDNAPNGATFSMVQNCISNGRDPTCEVILSIHKSLGSHPSLSREMTTLTTTLTALNQSKDTSAPGTILFGDLAVRLQDVVKAAQEKFCIQLQKNRGEHMGMLLYELGDVISQATWLHSNLTLKFLSQLRTFPPREVLEAMFDQLQNSEEKSDPQDARFKPYLASTLGGAGGSEAGTVTLAAFQKELRFWQHPPDTVRKDLAIALAKIHSLNYSLYTTVLLETLKEDDLYIGEIKYIITQQSKEKWLKFSEYIARRRSHRQLQNECWLFLLVCSINEQGPTYLREMAHSIKFAEWLKIAKTISSLMTPVHGRLPLCGIGLTGERLTWWNTLAQNMTSIEYLLNAHGSLSNAAWLYFPSSQTQITDLFAVISKGKEMPPIHRQVIAYLSPGGTNIALICECIESIRPMSAMGREVIVQRILSRKELFGRESWSDTVLSLILEGWSECKTFTPSDQSALGLIKRLLNYPVLFQSQTDAIQATIDRLESDSESFLHRARKLEALRLRAQRQKPRETSTICGKLGVHNSINIRASDPAIPDDLIDAVEPIGEHEYELSFDLTRLNDLQRKSRGLSEDSRLLLVRLSLQRYPQFCTHFSPNDEGQVQHRYWRTGVDAMPHTDICSTQSSLFTFNLNRRLHHLLQKPGSTLQSIHSAVSEMISSCADCCMICLTSLNATLFKPATCSKKCTKVLRKAPLEVRLHNLLVNPQAMDLLLTAVFTAAADQTGLDLLPRCPVAKPNIQAVINSYQPLSTYQTATDLRAAIRGNDALGSDREKLLSWLCLSFRGFILDAPSGYRVPSMPNTQQFVLFNSSQDREQLYNAQSTSTGGVVFHGTPSSRLFLILTKGLKTMTGTQFMFNGGAMGAGVYCGDDQATSLGYAGNIGQSWSNSALSNMRVMLGCELANYTAPTSGTYHCVTDHHRLLVRYVFLLPQVYQPPPRHHVEPAMSTAFATIRSSLLI